jgi:hypothetical protein
MEIKMESACDMDGINQMVIQTYDGKTSWEEIT